MPLILVIDDQEMIRFTLRTAFERSGFEVIEAPNGAKALDQLRRRAADLVVTDILMPEMEGIETIRHLKREFPEIKIVAISGGGRMDKIELLAQAGDFGADAALPKPFHPRKLIELVQELLGG